MIPFRQRPLRQKLFWILLAAGAASFAFSGAVILVYELKLFRPGEAARLHDQIELVQSYLVTSLAFNDVDEATEHLENLARHAQVVTACLWDADGELFASHGNGATDVGCPDQPPAEGDRFLAGHLSYSRPLYHDADELAGVLYVARPFPPLLARLPQYGLMLGSLVFALLVVLILQTTALDRLISGPILRLAQAAQEVRRRQDWSVRVRISTDDEVGRLTADFNQMLATIERHDAALRQAYDEQERLQAQLLRAQKMESIGRLAGGVAHDFNNYLTVIVGSADLTLARLPDDTPVRQLLENLRKATDQASQLTQQLLAFARQQIIEPRVIDPNRLLLDLEPMLASVAGDDVELDVRTHRGAWPIRADSQQMTQVLMNLVMNARDALPDGGKIKIEVSNVVLGEPEVADEPELEPGEYVLIRVSDNGIGMDEEALRRLFEPFFTTKEQGKGTGLGLATCYGIVKQSRGHIEVDSVPDQGSVFRIYLARSTRLAGRESSPSHPTSLPAGREIVLVVEDEPLVRETAVSLLRAQGYTVLEAAGGPEALRLVAEYAGVIDLLVTDVVMPKMSGREVADELRRMRPDLKVLYVSGYADVIAEQGELEEGLEFLQKPYTSETLMVRVRTLLDRGRGGSRDAAASEAEPSGSTRSPTDA